LNQQFIGRAKFLGIGHQFFFGHGLQAANIAQNLAGMAHSLDHVAGAGFAFGAHHGCAFANAAQGFAQVAAAADKRHIESVLVNVKRLIGGGQDFGFVNIIHTERLQDLRLNKMTDAAFSHYGDGDGIHDFEDEFGIAHASHAALGADIGGDAFERHYGAGTGFFGNPGLFGGDHIHNHAAFKHLSQSLLDRKGADLLFHT